MTGCSWTWCLLPLILLVSCGSPPHEIQKKLDEIAQADLDVILSDLPDRAKSQAQLAKPFYVIDEYQEFHGDTALVFQAYAALAFFYLDPSLELCQFRKYRYRRSARLWERYEVTLKHIPEKYVGVIPDSIRILWHKKP